MGATFRPKFSGLGRKVASGDGVKDSLLLTRTRLGRTPTAWTPFALAKPLTARCARGEGPGKTTLRSSDGPENSEFWEKLVSRIRQISVTNREKWCLCAGDFRCLSVVFSSRQN